MGVPVNWRVYWFVGGVVWYCGVPFLPAIVVGALVLALLLWMTGLHHTDGLLDFGDGVMAHGTPEHKIEVMHDQLTGAGGLSLGIMTMLITALAMGQLNIQIQYSRNHRC